MSNFMMKHTEFVSFRKERCPIRTTLQNNSYVFFPYKKAEKGKKTTVKATGKRWRKGGKEAHICEEEMYWYKRNSI